MDGLGAGTSFDESLDPPGYNYTSTPSTSAKRSNTSSAALQSSAEKIVEQMDSIVELRKAEITQKSKFEPLLKHLESLLEQLPQSTANMLGAKFTQMAYEEVEKHQTSCSLLKDGVATAKA
ncbi:uncharacterized protein LOC118756522 [Rhagoletis pomonella]|uniref:uncharacterized protein LOC118756522 n=1 Tax=Rhagoletis pomonella TaxID=28610 RepID=UPI00178162E5|nr:uncharacterized protein LOC118756522 [Rhagoletis pomonella]